MNTFTDHVTNLPTYRLVLGFFVILALGLTACGQSPGALPADVDRESEPSAEAAIEYEPAYPEDVNSEELSESDIAQQSAHSHENADHHHGEDMDHDEIRNHQLEDHDHGETGDLSHGEDDHSH